MCDRPADDKGVACGTEVTPEMIEAGYRACFGFDRECFPERVMAQDVIFAALEAAPEGWLLAAERLFEQRRRLRLRRRAGVT